MPDDVFVPAALRQDAIALLNIGDFLVDVLSDNEIVTVGQLADAANNGSLTKLSGIAERRAAAIRKQIQLYVAASDHGLASLLLRRAQLMNYLASMVVVAIVMWATTLVRFDRDELSALVAAFVAMLTFDAGRAVSRRRLVDPPVTESTLRSFFTVLAVTVMLALQTRESWQKQETLRIIYICLAFGALEGIRGVVVLFSLRKSELGGDRKTSYELWKGIVSDWYNNEATRSAMVNGFFVMAGSIVGPVLGFLLQFLATWAASASQS